MKQSAQQLERRYYDPGVNPQPTNPRPRTKKPHAKKRPYLAADSARLRNAELRRRRKAEKRNRDRAVILGATAPAKPAKAEPGHWKRRKLIGRALKALFREECR